MNHAQHGNMAMMHSVPTGLMPTGGNAFRFHRLMGYYQNLLINRLKLDCSKPLKKQSQLKFASDNKETEFWAYNGQLPGPQIEVFEGDAVEMEFINHLPQPSTVHWHA